MDIYLWLQLSEKSNQCSVHVIYWGEDVERKAVRQAECCCQFKCSANIFARGLSPISSLFLWGVSGCGASSIMVRRCLRFRRKYHSLSILNIFDWGVWDDKSFTQKTAMWSCGCSIFPYSSTPACLVPQASAGSLTLREDKFTSSSQVSSRFNQLALFTKRSQTAFNWVPNRTRWYWIQSAGKTGPEIQDAKISIENVWTHQTLMVFFLSFEYGELGSIIHYSWISLCGKSSISKTT